jgi:hypothetical protein
MEKVIIFYHIFLYEGVNTIVDEQLRKLYNSDLYKNATIKIFINDIYNGYYSLSDENMNLMKIITDDINYHKEHYFEIYTHIKMFESSLITKGYYLYMHTKGVTRINHKDEIHSQGLYSYKNVNNWRNLMEHFCIEKWRDCILRIPNYDLVGCNYIPNNVLPGIPAHYSGGFWWAKSDFIKKLPNPNDFINDKIDRFQAEFWIGRIKHKALCLFPIPKPIVEKHNRCFIFTPENEYTNNIIEQEFFN